MNVFGAPARSGIVTLRCQKKGPRFQNYFSSWHKCPQMQHIILRHLPSHEILLASPMLLLHSKSFPIAKTLLFHKSGPLEKYLSWQHCSHMIPLARSPWMSLITFRQAMSKLRLPQGHYRQYIFCCFFEDSLSHIIGLIYKYPHCDSEKKKMALKTKSEKHKEERKSITHDSVIKK